VCTYTRLVLVVCSQRRALPLYGGVVDLLCLSPLGVVVVLIVEGVENLGPNPSVVKDKAS